MFLNNSKFFAGVVMILLNFVSNFISVQFIKSAEEYLKLNITKQLLVFAMAWMGTRDIYSWVSSEGTEFITGADKGGCRNIGMGQSPLTSSEAPTIAGSNGTPLVSPL